MSSSILTAGARERLVSGLVRDFVDTLSSELVASNDAYAEGIARGGFTGFAGMTDAELVAEATGKGLDHLLPEVSP